MNITLHHQVVQCVDKGFDREALRITPKLTFSRGFSGSITFPGFEAWIDEPDSIKEQQARAMENALETWALFLSNPARFQ